MTNIILPFILTLIFLLYPTPAFAQGNIWQGNCVVDGVATIQGIGCVIQNITKFFVPLIIIAAVIMIIYAGAQIIMGADNPKAVAAGKQTLLFAIIGVIGISLSWIILVLIEVFTGAQVTVLDLIAPF